MFSLLAAMAVAAATPAVAPIEVGCAPENRDAATEIDPRRDIVIGPLVVMGYPRWARRGRDAFDGRGYKVSVTLLDNRVATLSVPPSLRGRVGFVYTPDAQDAVADRGVRGADDAVRFTACAGPADQRTGWPGGIVTNRRRCATLVVTTDDGQVIRRRAPLGRRC